MNNHGPGPKNNAPVKVKDIKGTSLKLWGLLKQYKISLLFVILFAIGSTVFTIIGPKILGNITTEIFNGLMLKISGTGGIDFDKINQIILVLVALYIVSLFFSFIQGFIMSNVSAKISYNLRKDLIEKINHLPMKFFDTKTHGEVLSRITNDVDMLTQSLNQSITSIITSIATLIGIFIMMVSINISMAIVVLLIVPFCMIVLGTVMKKSQIHFLNQQKFLGDMNGHVEEIYGGHDIVKAFNGEDKASVHFNEINHDLYDSAWKSQFLSTMMHPIMQFIGNLSYVVVSILGGYMVIKDKIAVGDILSFTQYARTFMQQISQLSQIMNMVQQALAASERVFEFLDEKEEVETATKPLPVDKIKGNIEFKHVQFGYNEDRIIIKDFSAKVKQGAKVAIVGPTGAGKSTMIKLLMRFYDVNSGAILVDGHDVRDFKRQDLRSIFGMVLQDTWLFSGTVADNIRYGKLDATLDEVREACKTASVDHFIRTLPDGYDMIINEEADNISGGQKQLLTIARVILADPKVLILDEATSSVDTRTELLIQDAMDKLMEGRTSFIIAHRLSTIKNADLIIVMNEGDIVETGNHEELLAKDGFYAKLYNSQFEEVEE
ncbi:MAG TPA: ABC transporter ATP-binding protein [Candidatus Fimihabitans intestinipullorum]|uniref:ABC transporter ATP-binding protein n=1 Tax=Candidatus Fimihabitans intestinipullorum TaxID=2840820 RepID=A0A9D1L426_9BACT|nr:ABC transporter ATP-binding protein [Candidatus Fimihabitans intestinipullorum]